MSKIWNNEKENLLKFWKEESNVHIWLSNKAISFYCLLNRAISIPCILISAISSTTILSNIHDYDSNELVKNDDTDDNDTSSFSCINNKEEMIISPLLAIGCILALGTFLQSLKEFLSLDSKISKFEQNIKTNRILILEIEEQLYLDRCERECPNKIIKKIKENKKNLVTDTPVIPAFIKRKLKKAIENNEVLDIMSKSILYSYLKNQTIEIDGTVFNNDGNNAPIPLNTMVYNNDTSNDTINYNTNYTNNITDITNDNLTSLNNYLPLSKSKTNSNSSNSSSDNNFENYKIDYDNSIKKMNQETKIDINLDKFNTTLDNSNINLNNSNIVTIDPNKYVKDKILTNLHCL
jgi:hypothetical protein